MTRDRRIKVSRSTHISLICLLVVFIFFMSCIVTRQPADQIAVPVYTVRVQGVELPFYADSTFVLRNEQGRYTLMYDTANRQARWVAYVLTRAECSGPEVGRTSKFMPDPRVISRNWPTARAEHYSNTGYDRGHLLPSADRNAGREENAATFLLSNVAPQSPKLNRGVWKSLEEKTREWALRYDSLYIVTGTITGDRPHRIKGNVSVPAAFYKAILVKLGGEWYAAAFMFSNESADYDRWGNYMIPVRRLEDLVGMDFFHSLPTEVSERAEVATDPMVWY